MPANFIYGFSTMHAAFFYLENVDSMPYHTNHKKKSYERVWALTQDRFKNEQSSISNYFFSFFFLSLSFSEFFLCYYQIAYEHIIFVAIKLSSLDHKYKWLWKSGIATDFATKPLLYFSISISFTHSHFFFLPT